MNPAKWLASPTCRTDSTTDDRCLVTLNCDQIDDGGNHGLEPCSGKLEAARRQAQGERGLLTDDDLTTIKGSRELLEGKIQERYGLAKDQARKQIDEWFTSQGF